jgi:Xaa-Pro aminopeptidase
MLYAVRMFVPDPFIYLRIRGRCHILLSDLEIDRGRKQSPHCRVVSLSSFQEKLRQKGIHNPRYSDIIATVLKERGLRRVTVPENFPLMLADELKAMGISLRPRKGTFFPQREQKSADEVKRISAALAMAEVGLAEGIEALRSCRIGRDRRLIYRNAPMTSGRLRAIIDTAIVQANGLASHTIVAGGKQACDPHECGHGILRANEPIILDIFPRSQKTGYFGDITRTVVKGRANEAVRKLYDTVWRGQKLAISKMKANEPTRKIHQAVLNFFQQEGYETGRRKGRMEGFFHGTGHGLGLEIHEPPRVGLTSTSVLKVGNIVTVEPGLYYPEIGGVRLEDVVLVTKTVARNLTRFEKVLEL